MQAMQWVQALPQTGLPPRRVMLFIGQRAAQRPQPVQASPAAKAFAFTQNV